MSDVALPSPDVPPAAALRPIAVTGARAASAVALHVVVTGLLAWVIDPVISETAWGWPTAAQVGQFWLLWMQATAVPALVWTALVLVRAASRRRVEGTWFALSAIVAAIVAFALAVPLIVLQVPVQATGMALSSWILAACAGVVVIAATAVRDRRAASARAEAAVESGTAG